jgi:DNA-directed RNA polymerase specialized sigma24 family protein
MDHQRSRWRELSGRRPAMGDAALLAALRCEDEGALREFYLRFRPMLLRAAGRLDVDPGDRDALVDDCLTDVAVHFITSTAPPPRSLPAYLTRSLRNRLLNGVRARARADRRDLPGKQAESSEAELAGSSQYARRSSGALEATPLSPVLERLAKALVRDLSADERLLAAWMSHCAPPRDIAAWLGIAYKAAAKRIERLRERLQLAALRHLETTDGEERRELLTFLGRASLGAGPAARLATVRDVAKETA